MVTPSGSAVLVVGACTVVSWLLAIAHGQGVTRLSSDVLSTTPSIIKRFLKCKLVAWKENFVTWWIDTQCNLDPSTRALRRAVDSNSESRLGVYLDPEGLWERYEAVGISTRPWFHELVLLPFRLFGHRVSWHLAARAQTEIAARNVRGVLNARTVKGKKRGARKLMRDLVLAMKNRFGETPDDNPNRLARRAFGLRWLREANNTYCKGRLRETHKFRVLEMAINLSFVTLEVEAEAAVLLEKSRAQTVNLQRVKRSDFIGRIARWFYGDYESMGLNLGDSLARHHHLDEPDDLPDESDDSEGEEEGGEEPSVELGTSRPVAGPALSKPGLPLD
jgi:hypothetical protein